VPPDDLAVAALLLYVERVLGPLAGRTSVTVEETSKLLGVGRSAGYDAVRRGDLPVIRIGHRAVVPTPALVALLLGVPSASDWFARIMAANTNGEDKGNGKQKVECHANGDILIT
jgi:hypothetical protein